MKFNIGDRVSHCKWGEGTVISSSKQDDMPLVEFDKPMGGHSGTGTNKNNVIGKNLHCWYLAENRLTLVEPSPSRNWKLIILPDKSNSDITNATLYVGGKATRHESVKRYYKDAYDTEAAVKAVMAKMYAPVKVEPAKVVEVKRPAKVGEWIKVVNILGDCGTYKIGDIMQVTSLYWDSDSGVWCGYHPLNTCEYVVLENYTPPVSEPKPIEPIEVEPPKPEPIMINGMPLKVGSKFILKNIYDETETQHLGKLGHDILKRKSHTVDRISNDNKTLYFISSTEGNFKFEWRITPSAIDRILED